MPPRCACDSGLASPPPASARQTKAASDLTYGRVATVHAGSGPEMLENVGSKKFAELRAAGLNGMYLTDQALHQTALLVSALLITLV